MEGRLPRLRLPTETNSPKFNYLSPLTKRSLTSRGLERINFNKNGFSSPKCVRASHEMLIPLKKIFPQKIVNIDASKSILINNRRIGEKLLLDSFPAKAMLDQ